MIGEARTAPPSATEALPADPMRRYEALRDAGIAAAERGELEAALELHDRALGVARELGDSVLADRALCNYGQSAIALDRGETVVGELREILVRNGDLTNTRLAAYHIAAVYQYRKEYKKALFYAQIALERSRRLERDDWVASSLNAIGNILLAECQIERATRKYEEALALIGESRAVWKAHIFDNLGYCRFLQGRHGEGLAYLYRSLRTLRRLHADRFVAEVHKDLAFALLELDRPYYALRHALRALRLADEHDLEGVRKNSLYLLGQCCVVAGDHDRARDYFSLLQSHYPEMPQIADLLVTYDIRQVVNLKA